MGFSFPFPMQSPSRWDLYHLTENLQAVCTSYAKLNKPNATAYSTRRNSELLNLQLETKSLRQQTVGRAASPKMILASSQTASVGWHKAQHKHLPVKAVAVPTIMQM